MLKTLMDVLYNFTYCSKKLKFFVMQFIYNTKVNVSLFQLDLVFYNY